MAASVASPHVLNIADLRRLAEARLPRAVFDYIDGGADAEITLRENCGAFERVLFRPRNAVATSSVTLETTVLGQKMAMPMMLAPVGSSRMFFPRGEEVAAREAGRAGLHYILSTLSGCRAEDVKAATTAPAWYQLYLVGGRDVARAGIERAKSLGYSALVVTIDTPVAGLRERDVRAGVTQLLSRRIATMAPYVPQFLSKPGWLLSNFADGGLMPFANVRLPDGPMGYADVGAALEQSKVSWADFAWIRDAWGGPIVVKGAHTAEDARHALGEGAAAIVVSNHGGRQLDTVAATLRVLPEIVEAVGDRAEVLLDGGIRRGSDIAKALCLGARAILVGRAYAYGLGAAGGPGVQRAIEILKGDLLRTMKLLGCGNVADLDGSYVQMPADWHNADRR